MKNILTVKKMLAIAIGATLATAAAQVSIGQGDEEEGPDLDVALFFELNDTDGDLGFQGLVDGDAWKRLEIEGPGELELMNIWVRNALRRQGMAELFFESDEPTFDEQSPAQFFKRFPRGIYEVEVLTLDNQELESEVRVSHVMPGPPQTITVNGQPQAPNCDAEELPEVDGPVTIDWSPVTKSHPTVGTPNVDVTVVQYQFVGEIEREDRVPDELVFSVDLPRFVTRFTLPEEFTRLSLDGEVKYEIITKLRNGNQTGVESCFEIEQ